MSNPEFSLYVSHTLNQHCDGPDYLRSNAANIFTRKFFMLDQALDEARRELGNGRFPALLDCPDGKSLDRQSIANLLGLPPHDPMRLAIK